MSGPASDNGSAADSPTPDRGQRIALGAQAAASISRGDVRSTPSCAVKCEWLAPGCVHGVHDSEVTGVEDRADAARPVDPAHASVDTSIRPYVDTRNAAKGPCGGAEEFACPSNASTHRLGLDTLRSWLVNALRASSASLRPSG